MSAGSKPSMVHPLAIQVMAEIGVDISHHRSKFIDSLEIEDVTHIIALCKEEICPYVPSNVVHEHWPIDDPTESCSSEEDQIQRFREVRDNLQKNILEWRKRLTKA
jgi:arsenate reductase